MTINATVNLSASIREILAAAAMPTASSDSGRTILHDAWTYVLPTTLAPDNIVAKEHALAGTDDTIDLTAAPQSAGQAAADLTGKKLYGIFLYAAAANSGDITFGPGDSNAYVLWGASQSVTLHKGDYLFYINPNINQAAVAAAVKNLKIAGTDGDKLTLGLLFT